MHQRREGKRVAVRIRTLEHHADAVKRLIRGRVFIDHRLAALAHFAETEGRGRHSHLSLLFSLIKVGRRHAFRHKGHVALVLHGNVEKPALPALKERILRNRRRVLLRRQADKRLIFLRLGLAGEIFRRQLRLDFAGKRNIQLERQLVSVVVLSLDATP